MCKQFHLCVATNYKGGPYTQVPLYSNWLEYNRPGFKLELINPSVTITCLHPLIVIQGCCTLIDWWIVSVKKVVINGWRYTSFCACYFVWWWVQCMMYWSSSMQKRVNRHFEIMFETGVDEMSWDDTVSKRVRWGEGDRRESYKV